MLTTQIQSDLKDAMKRSDAKTVAALRFLAAHLKNVSIEKRRDLTDDEVLAATRTLVKKSKESIRLFREGGREDLVQTEQESLDVLEQYLPTQLSEAETRSLVEEVIAEVGATSMRDMGAVIGKVMERAENRADGKMVSSLVKEALT